MKPFSDSIQILQLHFHATPADSMKIIPIQYNSNRLHENPNDSTKLFGFNETHSDSITIKMIILKSY